MLKNIIEDLRKSTLTEKILLGVVAGIFSVIGFYLGYAHLSNGVDPFIVGLIAAVIVPIGAMSIAFILDEIYKSLKRKFGKKKPAVETQETDSEESTETPETVSDNEQSLENRVVVDENHNPIFAVETMPESEGIRVLPTTDGINDDYETIGTPVSEEESQPEAEENVIADPVDDNLQDAPEKPQEASEATQGTYTVPQRPERPTRPSMIVVEPVEEVVTDTVTVEEPVAEPFTPVDDAVVETVADPADLTDTIEPTDETSVEPELDESVEETNDDSLKLVDFIKAHPEYSPRKMAREYERAGGKDSTENILDLM